MHCSAGGHYQQLNNLCSMAICLLFRGALLSLNDYVLGGQFWERMFVVGVQGEGSQFSAEGAIHLVFINGWSHSSSGSSIMFQQLRGWELACLSNRA